MKHALWAEIAEMMGVGMTRGQVRALERYRQWLVDEALVAGGLGPAEQDRLDTRHIGDSLLFAVAMPYVPGEVWDLGSGVGLPGIPLAILYPETGFILLERSGRRADLLDRALRILDLPNTRVSHMDVRDLEPPVEALVSRATLSPRDTANLARRVLEPEGFALVGGSWTKPPSYPDWEIVEIQVRSLEHSVWILIMRGQ